MYAKLFTSIYQGTLRGQSHVLLVFTNLLAHADRDGIADIHPRAIAEEVGLTTEEVRVALQLLEQPDYESRSPEEEGRRIVRLDEHRAWGWRIVNYIKYRSIRNEEDRREQNREAQARFKAKAKAGKPESAQVSRGQPQKAHTEAEADVEAKPISGAPSSPDGSDKKRGSRLPEEWEPGEDGATFANNAGIAGQRFHDEAAKFRDYWSAQPGAKGRKTDWPATWRNWCRNVQQKPSGPPVPQWKRDQLARIAEFAGPAAAKPLGEAIDVDSRFLDG